jgi:glucokinase
MSSANITMGVDIGGTHITVALIDLHSKIIIPTSLQRAAVNAAGDSDEIIHAWASCMTDVKQNHEIESICIAMPGPFDYEAGISLMRGQDKYEKLYGLNIKELLAKSLAISKQSIFIDNDAACFLQGEVFNGIATAYNKNTVAGITLGTGLGSAVYKDGKSRNADMWCWPFKEGIAEDYLSTRWFVQRWNQLTGETISGVKELISHDNNEKVKELFAEFTVNLSAFLSDFIMKEKAAAVVIGGNIAKAFDRFAPELIAMINNQHPGIIIKQAMLGEEAQLLGAVGAWLQKLQAASH